MPSSDEVASCVYSGWKASDVMLPLCPLSSYFAGFLRMNRSSALPVAFCFFEGRVARSFLRLSFISSRADIFFCSASMDFHLISSLLPSGSTSARLTPI